MTNRMPRYISKRWTEITSALAQNHLWQRMLKNTLTTSLAIGISLIHYDTKPAFGKAAYLSAMVTVFAHPGRRFGQLVEAVVLVLIGLVIGVAWAIFGLWLSSLMIHSNPPAAYAIRAVFLVVALMSHGFFRSHTPRIFLLVLLLIIETLTALTTTSTSVTPTVVTQLVYPPLMAIAVILLVNVTVFPEFSSSYLGQTTIDNLGAASTALRTAGAYFVGFKELPTLPKNGERAAVRKNSSHSSVKDPQKKGQTKAAKVPTLAEIIAAKDELRSKLSATRNAQNETQFEIAYSHLPPRLVSPISKKGMKRLVTHIIAVIGTCESRFALLGDETFQEETKSDSGTLIQTEDSLEPREVDLKLLKPKREIEFGDVRLLRFLLAKIKDPYISFQGTISHTVDVIISCVAYAYDVPKLPSKAKTPSHISLEEIETLQTTLRIALETFDSDVTATLESAATLQDINKKELDIMPREEIFLIASFLLNVRQASTQVAEMLQTSKLLVQQRSESGKWRRLFLPRIRWRKWLQSGGEIDEAMPANERRPARKRPASKENALDKKPSLTQESRRLVNEPDTEAGIDSKDSTTGDVKDSQNSLPDRKTRVMRARHALADLLDWMMESEDFSYAFKLTIATFLVTFPAFIPSLNTFYSYYRGTWAALQLIFVFDVAIGTSIWNAYIRAIGTTLGSLWGWAAYAAGGGNPYVCTAMLFIGLIPSTYVQLGSQYAKAGMVTIVSMCVVALATELQTVPGTSTENFLNRWIAFLIGGVVALAVEMTLLPVKARSRLVEALTSTIRHIGEMESCVGYGIETGVSLGEGFPPHVFKSFEKASSKAKSALSDADTFIPFCTSEPRLKGSFKSVAKIYEEIIFVLRQIVDKMDNMIQLRLAYGSGPLEEFNTSIYPYRRNVAGAVSLILYAAHEALSTKFPLPQFIPSARLAHLRLINRIREVVQKGVGTAEGEDAIKADAIKRALRRRYMSWNAASAAQVEIIEYLEELTDLVKLLVGANEFRSGLLARPTLQEYGKAIGDSSQLPTLSKVGSSGKHQDEFNAAEEVQKGSGEDLPISLQRIQSRRQEAGLKKRQGYDTISKTLSGSE